MTVLFASNLYKDYRRSCQLRCFYASVVDRSASLYVDSTTYISGVYFERFTLLIKCRNIYAAYAVPGNWQVNQISWLLSYYIAERMTRINLTLVKIKVMYGMCDATVQKCSSC